MENHLTIDITNYVDGMIIETLLKEHYNSESVAHLQEKADNADTFYYKTFHFEDGFLTKLHLVLPTSEAEESKKLNFIKFLAERTGSEILFDVGYPDGNVLLVQEDKLFLVKWILHKDKHSISYDKEKMMEIKEKDFILMHEA